MSNKNTLTVVRSREVMRLIRDHDVDELLIHMGTPTTKIDINGHKLTWRKLEVLGKGRAEIWDGPRLLFYWSQPCTLGAL